jgi:DNA-directed RNA polymerase
MSQYDVMKATNNIVLNVTDSHTVTTQLEAKGVDIDERADEIYSACGYLASATMDVMGDLFQGARKTMNWLTTCARLISSQGQPVTWMSATGVPAVQPYRQRQSYRVVTLLQSVVLINNNDNLPVHKSRQTSAFPPNYIHSLDSAHMLLTAIEMDKRGLAFTAVHDSFWTHPSDIDEMNDALRSCFVDLYNRPLLEELKETWELQYPSLEFPELPERGNLDLNEVKQAPYFFQ